MLVYIGIKEQRKPARAFVRVRGQRIDVLGTDPTARLGHPRLDEFTRIGAGQRFQVKDDGTLVRGSTIDERLQLTCPVLEPVTQREEEDDRHMVQASQAGGEHLHHRGIRVMQVLQHHHLGALLRRGAQGSHRQVEHTFGATCCLGTRPRPDGDRIHHCAEGLQGLPHGVREQL